MLTHCLWHGASSLSHEAPYCGHWAFSRGPATALGTLDISWAASPSKTKQHRELWYLRKVEAGAAPSRQPQQQMRLLSFLPAHSLHISCWRFVPRTAALHLLKVCAPVSGPSTTYKLPAVCAFCAEKKTAVGISACVWEASKQHQCCTSLSSQAFCFLEILHSISVWHCAPLQSCKTQ